MDHPEQIEFYIKLLETTPDIKYVYDLEEKKLIYVNDNVTALLGYTPEELKELKENFISIFHTEYRELFIAETAKLMNFKDNEVNELEYKLLHKNGDHLWFSCCTMVFKRNVGGVPIQLIGVAQDISEKKIIREKVNEQFKDIEFLSKTALQLNKFSDSEDVYNYIISILKNIQKETIIILTTTADDETLVVNKVEGIEQSRILKLIERVGFNPIGKTFKIEDEFKEIYKKVELHEYKGNISDYLIDNVSSSVTAAIQKLFGINKVYSIGLVGYNKLLGGIHFLTLNDADVKNKIFIEAFIYQASIAIERCQIFNKIREDKNKLSGFMDNSSDGILLIDDEGKIITWNKTLEEIIEIKSAEVVGKNIKDLPFHKYSDDQKTTNLHKIINDILFRSDKNVSSEIIEREIIPVSGRKKIIQFKYFYVKLDKKHGIGAVFRDVTELRQKEKDLETSEIRFKDFANLTLAAIGEWDAEGKITYVNNIAPEYTGYSKKEFYDNFNITKLLVPEDRKRAVENIKKVIEGKESSVNEYHALRKDGSTYYVITKTQPVIKDGKIIGVRGVFLDISDRKKAELALKESEERFRNLADLLPSFVFEMNTEGIFTYVNKFGLEISGYTKKEVDAGISTFQFFLPEEIQKAKDNTLATLSGKDLPPHEYRMIFKDKKIYYVIGKSNAIVKDGKIIGVRGVFFDITDRKKAELALKESEERYRNLTDMLPVFVYEVDDKYNVTYINKFGLDFLKARKEDIEKGISALDVFTPEYKQKAIDNINSILAGNILPSHGYDMVDKEGNIFHVIAKSAPIFREGKFCGLRGVFIDITERKKAEESLRESEEKFRVLIENTPDIIVRVSKDLKILYINPSIQNISKIPLEKFVGKTFSELGVSEKFCSFWEENITKAFKTGKAHKTEYTYELKKRNVYLNLRIIPELDYLREVKSVLVIAQEVSEQKSNEIKINEALQEKDTLINELHHRVKNNFQIITSLLNLQEEDIKDSKQLEIFLKAKARIRTMTLIHEKLYESKNFSKIDFAEYIKSITEELHHAFFNKTKKIKIIYNLDKISINIDKAIPCGIILNELITNSFKHAFTGSQSKLFVIKITLLKTPGKRINLTINDNGKGISEKINVEKPGTLGLQLVSLLAKQLRATISLDRRKGTKWNVTF
ncbi:MAG: PAS domain S-box protein [Bacteroidales bacterium]|nr:PAS domain S-box protein [Bacteroidales bacterium]